MLWLWKRRYKKTNSKNFYTKDKKDLLFLHGYLSSGSSFYYQTQFFKQYFNVYAPDLKGFGENKDMPYPYSLDDYVNEVSEYINKNSIVCPFVIAHSFGARIVLKGLSDKKFNFSKVVITGGAGLKPKFRLKKTIKKAQFNFSVTYEIDGEEKIYSGIYVCEYDGIYLFFGLDKLSKKK